jgi:hypothetical protein
MIGDPVQNGGVEIGGERTSGMMNQKPLGHKGASYSGQLLLVVICTIKQD